jgi:hypothetical protein
MVKKALFFAIALLFLFPLGASAQCDLSVKNFRALSERYLDGAYQYNPMGLRKPKLIVSSKKVKDYYAEELNGKITIYPKAFSDSYCDQYIDGLTPAVANIINHEYTHYLDEKLNLSQKIGERKMSEKTANIGAHVFENLVWKNNFAGYSGESAQKYTKLKNIIQKGAPAKIQPPKEQKIAVAPIYFCPLFEIKKG